MKFLISIPVSSMKKVQMLVLQREQYLYSYNETTSQPLFSVADFPVQIFGLRVSMPMGFLLSKSQKQCYGYGKFVLRGIPRIPWTQNVAE